MDEDDGQHCIRCDDRLDPPGSVDEEAAAALRLCLLCWENDQDDREES